MIAIAEAIGQPLMPWQQLVAMVGGELLPDGRPAFREVIVTVPRQAGKTTVALAWEMQRCIGWGKPQRVAYSAQTGNDARKKLIEDQVPLLAPVSGVLGIRRILRGMGNEAIEFRNGSRVVLLASGEDSGHGKTLDMAVKDELFADADDRRDQALIPAMATKPFAQVLTLSTAGTEASVALRRAVDRGREAVQAGRREGVAYFEWSAPEDAPIDDPATWWSCHPALGHTITEDVIRHALDTMAEGEFRRAFLNQWTRSDERVLPIDAWEACRTSEPLGVGLVLGVDANPERSAAAIGVADVDGRCELIEYRSGTGWLVDRVVEIVERHGAAVTIDPAGPAGVFVSDLERRGVPVVATGGRDVLQACAALYDAVIERKARIWQHYALDAAVAGATKRQVGDSWCWARRNAAVDVSPLVAVTLAAWRARNPQERGPVFVSSAWL